VISQKSLNIQKEFSKYAKSYGKYNIIQKKVAKELLSKLPKIEYQNIIDLGAGSGTIYSYLTPMISYKYFYALDYSQEMLKIHPENKQVIKTLYDFNTQKLADLNINIIDLLISSSALQWCSNLNRVLNDICDTSTNIALAIFTNNTFKQLHTTALIESPILPKEYILEAINSQQKFFDIEIKEYKLFFESKKDIFRYIKKSGVSGGNRKLSYKQTKKLIEEYPYDYLEFEVVFATSFDK
jgi:malonyl-CoA O-methyltransferase